MVGELHSYATDLYFFLSLLLSVIEEDFNYFLDRA